MNEKFMMELNVLEMYRIVVRGIGQVFERVSSRVWVYIS